MSLEVLTAECLHGTQHGFFTRKGGASSGIYEGLNCGAGSTDQAEIVAINRARVAAHMGVTDKALMSVHQIHSPDVVTVTDLNTPRSQADAMVTNVPGLALGILTADCQPVLLRDRDAGVIGAAHAGWKGAMRGVLKNTVTAMEALGAHRENIHAAVGPCISQSAYEVGPEFVDSFVAKDPALDKFFAQGTGDRMLFDLPGYGVHLLRSAGVGQAEWTGECTYQNEARYYSYRRTTHRKEADYGRLISVIRL